MKLWQLFYFQVLVGSRGGQKPEFFQNPGFGSNPGFKQNYSSPFGFPMTLQYMGMCHGFMITFIIRIIPIQFLTLKLGFEWKNFRLQYATIDYDLEKFHTFVVYDTQS